jgi:hypothetical protein
MSNIKILTNIMMTDIFGSETANNEIIIFERKFGFLPSVSSFLPNVCDVSVAILTRYIQHLAIYMSINGITPQYIKDFMRRKDIVFFNSVNNWCNFVDDQQYLMALWYTLAQQFFYAVQAFANATQAGVFNVQNFQFSIERCQYDFIPYYFNAMFEVYNKQIHCNVSYEREVFAIIKKRTNFVTTVPFRLYDHSGSDTYGTDNEKALYVNYPGDNLDSHDFTILHSPNIGYKGYKEYNYINCLVRSKKCEILKLNPNYMPSIQPVVVNVPLPEVEQKNQEHLPTYPLALSTIAKEQPLLATSLYKLYDLFTVSQVAYGTCRLSMGDITCRGSKEMLQILISEFIQIFTEYISSFCKCGKIYRQLMRYSYDGGGKIEVYIIRHAEFLADLECPVKTQEGYYVGKGLPPEIQQYGAVSKEGIHTCYRDDYLLRRWNTLLFSVNADLWLLVEKLMTFSFHPLCKRRGSDDFCSALFVRRIPRFDKYLEAG